MFLYAMAPSINAGTAGPPGEGWQRGMQSSRFADPDCGHVQPTSEAPWPFGFPRTKLNMDGHPVYALLARIDHAVVIERRLA
jgi:hypothetical protein